MSAPVPALLIAAVGGAALAACTADGEPEPAPSTTLSSGPGRALWEAAVAREISLLAAYDSLVTDHPALAVLAAEARDHHRQHLAALESVTAAPARSTSPTASPSPSASGSSPEATAAPGDPVDAARDLLVRERTAGDAAVAAVHRTGDLELSLVLARIAASETQHATALHLALREGLVRRRRPGSTPAVPG